MAPHRDPETGKFLAEAESQYDDIEMATFNANAGIEAANLTGGTAFGGGDRGEFEAVEVIDYDEFVDRNEELELLAGWHAITVYQNSTSTADGTVAAAVEVSADPSNSNAFVSIGSNTLAGGGVDVRGSANQDDTIDAIGRTMYAVGHGPYTDGTTGTGGAGSAGTDHVEFGSPPLEAGRFHPRDELFVNGQFAVWNIDDAGVHVDVQGQHWYGVRES